MKKMYLKTIQELRTLIMGNHLAGNVKQEKRLVLIGGLSRAGKSYISNMIKRSLCEENVPVKILQLDHWLISKKKRKYNSKITERFEMDKIGHSIAQLLNGKSEYPPVYDSKNRTRRSESGAEMILADDEILIAEGIIALAITELFEMALLKVYVESPEERRLSKLRDFYLNYKKVSEMEFQELMSKRDKEEVPFIRSTKKMADVVFFNF